MGDHKVFQDRFIELRSALMQDLAHACQISFLSGDFRYFETRVRNEGVEFCFKTLPQLGKALDAGLITGSFLCPPDFRKYRDTALPIFLNKVFAHLFEDNGCQREYVPAHIVYSLRQFLLFDSKVVIPYKPERVKAAEDAFSNSQSELRKIKLSKLPSGVNVVLAMAQRIITRTFERHDIDTLSLDPNHGPGSVAEHYNVCRKWEFSSWPKKLERYYPYLQYGVYNLPHAMISRTGVPLTKKLVTRACFVPKDFRGPRLISIEPTAMQYVQQGMRHRLERIIGSYPCNLSINLRDQNVNRESARVAYERDMATVDLSSASDTLSLPLVWHLFSGVPKWRNAICRLRSDFVGFPTKDVRLVAFAPMGSAICFPTETLCFWALSVATVMSQQRVTMIEACRLVKVFGDDIILPVGQVEVFTDLALQLGLHVNVEKTCYRSPFRESCGSEWWDGNDVSIIRNKSFPYPDSLGIEHQPILRDLQRRLFSKGLEKSAEVVLNWCREIAPVATIHPSYLRHKGADLVDIDCYCYSNSCSLAGLKVRWNCEYQRIEARIPVVLQRTLVWKGDDLNALMASLVDSSYSERIAPRGGNTKWAWRDISDMPQGNLT